MASGLRRGSIGSRRARSSFGGGGGLGGYSTPGGGVASRLLTITTGDVPAGDRGGGDGHQYFPSVTIAPGCRLTVIRYGWTRYLNPSTGFARTESGLIDVSTGHVPPSLTVGLGADLGVDIVGGYPAGSIINFDPGRGPIYSAGASGLADSGETVINQTVNAVDLTFFANNNPEYGATGTWSFTAYLRLTP